MYKNLKPTADKNANPYIYIGKQDGVDKNLQIFCFQSQSPLVGI